MKNYISSGDVLEITLTAAATSGTGVLVGSLFGIAQTNGAIGDTIAVITEGVVDHAAASADVIAVGDKLYWDAANKVFTSVVGTNKFVAIAVKAKAAGATVVRATLLSDAR